MNIFNLFIQLKKMWKTSKTFMAYKKVNII